LEAHPSDLNEPLHALGSSAYNNSSRSFRSRRQRVRRYEWRHKLAKRSSLQQKRRDVTLSLPKRKSARSAFGQGYKDLSPAVDRLERLVEEGKLPSFIV
jgi:hypothetical protein